MSDISPLQYSFQSPTTLHIWTLSYVETNFAFFCYQVDQILCSEQIYLHHPPQGLTVL